MPNKRKRTALRFPPARIKKIMQKDEEVGKVAAAVPIIISRTLELFLESFLKTINQLAKANNVKTLSSELICDMVNKHDMYKFLRPLVDSTVKCEPKSSDKMAASSKCFKKSSASASSASASSASSTTARTQLASSTAGLTNRNSAVSMANGGTKTTGKRGRPKKIVQKEYTINLADIYEDSDDAIMSNADIASKQNIKEFAVKTETPTTSPMVSPGELLTTSSTLPLRAMTSHPTPTLAPPLSHSSTIPASLPPPPPLSSTTSDNQGEMNADVISNSHESGSAPVIRQAIPESPPPDHVVRADKSSSDHIDCIATTVQSIAGDPSPPSPAHNACDAKPVQSPTSPLTPAAILTADEDDNSFIIKNAAADVITRPATDVKPHSMPFKMSFSTSVLLNGHDDHRAGDTTTTPSPPVQPPAPMQSYRGVGNAFTPVHNSSPPLQPLQPLATTPVKSNHGLSLTPSAPLTPQRPQGPSDLYRSSPRTRSPSSSALQTPRDLTHGDDDEVTPSIATRFLGLSNNTPPPPPMHRINSPRVPFPDQHHHLNPAGQSMDHRVGSPSQCSPSHTVLRPTPQHPHLNNSAYRLDVNASRAPAHLRLHGVSGRPIEDDPAHDPRLTFAFNNSRYINSETNHNTAAAAFLRKPSADSRDDDDVSRQSEMGHKHSCHVPPNQDKNRLHYTELMPMKKSDSAHHHHMFSMNSSRNPVQESPVARQIPAHRHMPAHQPLHLLNPSNHPLHPNPALNPPHFVPQQYSPSHPNSHQKVPHLITLSPLPNTPKSFQSIHRNFQSNPQSESPHNQLHAVSHPPHLQPHQNSQNHPKPQHIQQANTHIFSPSSQAKPLTPSSSYVYPRTAINNHSVVVPPPHSATPNQYPPTSSSTSSSSRLDDSQHSREFSTRNNSKPTIDSAFALDLSTPRNISIPTNKQVFTKDQLQNTVTDRPASYFHS